MKQKIKRVLLVIVIVYAVGLIASYILLHVIREADKSEEANRPVIDLVVGENVGPCMDEQSCKNYIVTSQQDIKVVMEGILKSGLPEGRFDINLAETEDTEKPYITWGETQQAGAFSGTEDIRLVKMGGNALPAMVRLFETGWNWGDNQYGSYKYAGQDEGVKLSTLIVKGNPESGKFCTRNSQLNVYYYPSDKPASLVKAKALDGNTGWYYSISSYSNSC